MSKHSELSWGLGEGREGTAEDEGGWPGEGGEQPQ